MAAYFSKEAFLPASKLKESCFNRLQKRVGTKAEKPPNEVSKGTGHGHQANCRRAGYGLRPKGSPLLSAELGDYIPDCLTPGADNVGDGSS